VTLPLEPIQSIRQLCVLRFGPLLKVTKAGRMSRSLGTANAPVGWPISTSEGGRLSTCCSAPSVPLCP
jgi:hypothetical protein